MRTRSTVTLNGSGSRILAEFMAQREAERAMMQARGVSLPSRTHMPRPFQAAAHDRLTASWFASRQSINDELLGDLDALRSRARQVAKNNGYGRKFLKMVARNVVGPKGFVLQARIQESPDQPDSAANAAVELAFFNWAQRGSAEITGRMSFNDLCRAVIRAVARDGEALVALVRGSEAGNSEGLALQLIDVARLDTQRNHKPGRGQNAVIMGVEIDSYQRPQAYWIKERPDGGSSAAVRYPAADILHLYVVDEPEQVRGIPWMHAAMLDTHDLGEFNRSALLAARKGADTLGFIVAPNPELLEGDDEDADGIPLTFSAPGTYEVLPDGYDIRTPDAQYPHAAYDPFTKSILRRIASGLDVSYNSLANDLEGVNFSSIRAGVLEERDEWTQIQNWFIDAFLEPVYREWFARAMTAGAITLDNGTPLPLAKATKFFAHEWQGRRWQWVDPMKDIEAARKAIQTGVASPQMVAAQNGVDAEDVLHAIAAFESMQSRLGVQSVRLVDVGKAAAVPANPSDQDELASELDDANRPDKD